MRAVAEELGTGPASLYWHVANKDELLDHVFDEIIGEVSLPETRGPWQEQLKELAREIRRVMNAHRDVARITLARIPTGPNALVVMDHMLGVMRRAGIPDTAIALGSDAAMLYVNAFCYEESVPFRAVGTTSEIQDSAQMLDEYLRSLPAETFPNFVALAPVMTSGDFEDRFEFGLDLVIRGLASHARPAAKRRAKRS